VVVKPGHQIDPDEVIGHCRARIASYKKPTHVEFVESVPRRDGAPDYDRLDEQYGGGNYPTGLRH
jgi:long-chain acyl-CoA synthetase